MIGNVGLVSSRGEIRGVGYSTLNAFGLIDMPDWSNVFAVGVSVFNMIGQIVTLLLVVLLSQRLANKFGKRNTFIVCLTLTALFTTMFYFVEPTSIKAMFIINILKNASYAPTIPLLWAMMADVADHSEWVNYRRAMGFVFAGVVFALKAGLGIGGAICGAIIDAFGFVPNAMQNESAIEGIKLSTGLIPGVVFFLGVIALFFYSITKGFNEKMQSELAERRKGADYL